MRPIRLELEGFTAFREKCEIDFSTFDLFAINWSDRCRKDLSARCDDVLLYGKTSRLNKTGKELISQGAASMSVLLHFRVGTNEYRVSRAIKGASPIAAPRKIAGRGMEGRFWRHCRNQ